MLALSPASFLLRSCPFFLLAPFPFFLGPTRHFPDSSCRHTENDRDPFWCTVMALALLAHCGRVECSNQSATMHREKRDGDRKPRRSRESLGFSGLETPTAMHLLAALATAAQAAAVSLTKFRPRHAGGPGRLRHDARGLEDDIRVRPGLQPSSTLPPPLPATATAAWAGRRIPQCARRPSSQPPAGSRPTPRCWPQVDACGRLMRLASRSGGASWATSRSAACSGPAPHRQWQAAAGALPDWAGVVPSSAGSPRLGRVGSNGAHNTRRFSDRARDFRRRTYSRRRRPGPPIRRAGGPPGRPGGARRRHKGPQVPQASGGGFPTSGGPPVARGLSNRLRAPTSA